MQKEWQKDWLKAHCTDRTYFMYCEERGKVSFPKTWLSNRKQLRTQRSAPESSHQGT